MGRLQRSFDIITDLFDHVGLHKNLYKTVSMIFQPCRSLGGMSIEAYTNHMSGEGETYRYQLCQGVRLPECGDDMNAGSLQMHLHNQHSVGWGYPNGNPPPRGVPLLPGFFLKDVGCVLMPSVGVFRGG